MHFLAHTLRRLKAIALIGLSAVSLSAFAQESTIRKNLAERLPSLPPIEEVRKTPMPGLFELRLNQNEIYYTDAEGNYLIQGSLIDTRARIDLTEQRLERLNAIAFKDLPLKDAFVIKRGNGKRKIAVFEDPNCGFCKRFERDLLKVDNVTVYVFLLPILSADSAEKSAHIWCSKDPAQAFLDWMIDDILPPKATCDTTPLQRNTEFGRKMRITGTPTTFLADGTRVSGAVGADRMNQLLNAQP